MSESFWLLLLMYSAIILVWLSHLYYNLKITELEKEMKNDD